MRETWVQSLGRENSPGEGNGNPLQYSCLENPMDRGAWWATVHGVAKSQTWLSDFSFFLSPYPRLPLWLRRWRIRLQCGRPGFDPWVGKVPWRRGWLPTPVFWPGEFHGQYSPWGHKESDVTEQLSLLLFSPFPTVSTVCSLFLHLHRCRTNILSQSVTCLLIPFIVS